MVKKILLSVCLVTVAALTVMAQVRIATPNVEMVLKAAPGEELQRGTGMQSLSISSVSSRHMTVCR